MGPIHVADAGHTQYDDVGVAWCRMNYRGRHVAMERRTRRKRTRIQEIEVLSMQYYAAIFDG